MSLIAVFACACAFLRGPRTIPDEVAIRVSTYTTVAEGYTGDSGNIPLCDFAQIQLNCRFSSSTRVRPLQDCPPEMARWTPRTREAGLQARRIKHVDQDRQRTPSGKHLINAHCTFSPPREVGETCRTTLTNSHRRERVCACYFAHICKYDYVRAKRIARSRPSLRLLQLTGPMRIYVRHQAFCQVVVKPSGWGRGTHIAIAWRVSREVGSVAHCETAKLSASLITPILTKWRLDTRKDTCRLWFVKTKRAFCPHNVREHGGGQVRTAYKRILSRNQYLNGQDSIGQLTRNSFVGGIE